MTLSANTAPAIVILGDIAVDMIGRLAYFPSPGDDCPISDLQFSPGGVGANSAVALARWGAQVRLAGCVGNDWFGELALQYVQDAGVDTSFVHRHAKVMTGLFFIGLDARGERTMIGSRGANEVLELSMLNNSLLEGARVFHVVGYSFLTLATERTAQELLKQAQSQGALTSMDAGLKPSRLAHKEILEAAADLDLLIANQMEASELSGENDPKRALAALENAGPKEVVLKLGARGSLMRHEGELCMVPGFSVETKDTTGAGDAFTAVYIWARAQDWPREEATLLGNAAGAASAATAGASESMPSPRQVRQILAGAKFGQDWEMIRQRLLEKLAQATSAATENPALQGD